MIDVARLVDVGGSRIAVREAGAGATLILLHGFPEDGAAWVDVLPHPIAAGMRAIVPDLPGHGLSDPLPELGEYGVDRLADRIVALADALEIDRFHIAGHDWGSAIAFAVAARHRSRVQSLTAIDAPHPDALLDAVVSDPLQLLRSAYIGFFQLPSVPERLLTAGGFALLKRSLQRTSRPGTFPDAEVERLAGLWAVPGRMSTMLAYYRALRIPRTPLGHVAAPTTILWGRHDGFVGVRLAAASADFCTHARIHVHPAATHWIHREEPGWVARHIVAAARA